jgi:transcriptional regulator with XRE-family HTH domain
MHHRRKAPRIANRLWIYRKRMGFTQQEVAEIIGYQRETHISDYEHGRKSPSLVTALKLEIVYRTPVAFLFPELYGRLKGQLRDREDAVRAERTRRFEPRQRRHRTRATARG